MNANEHQSDCGHSPKGTSRARTKTGDNGQKKVERDTIPNVPLGTSCRAFEAREWCSRERRQREAADLKTPMGDLFEDLAVFGVQDGPGRSRTRISAGAAVGVQHSLHVQEGNHIGRLITSLRSPQWWPGLGQ